MANIIEGNDFIKKKRLELIYVKTFFEKCKDSMNSFIC